MINLSFFPSKRIAWYMARLFLTRSLVILFALVLVLQTLDLLGESGKILAHDGNGDSQLWYYVSLRLPQLIFRFLPFSVLLGTLITLATLNQNSEIISMKAAGISAHQIIAPLILASFVVALVTFAFEEKVVTSATRTLNAWQAVEYGPVPKGGGRNNVWIKSGDDLIHAERVEGSGADTVLRGVSINQRDGLTLQNIVTASRAVPQGDAWRLDNVRRFDVNQTRAERLRTIETMRGIDPGQFTSTKAKPEEMDVPTLARTVNETAASGSSTAALASGLWHKISGPLSSVLMPLLASIAGFGLARSGGLFIRAVIGMALGFAYFVVDNFALAMGNLGAYPPFLAAWGPFLLFLLIGETVLIRTEE